MTNFAIIRLGKDSVSDILALDNLEGSPSEPISLTVRCSQVPSELAVDDFAFLCLGSDNNKGMATTWKRGLRALGRITSKDGGPGYNDPWQVGIDIRVVLSESVSQKDLLAKAPVAYYWCSDIPVLGVDTHSNQTVQIIKKEDRNQNVSALMYALSSIDPKFKKDVVNYYPELDVLFSYIPDSPLSITNRIISHSPADNKTLNSMTASFCQDARACHLRVQEPTVQRFVASLMAKRFLIATGLSGSGKTKLAQAFAHWISPSMSQSGKSFELVAVGADWVSSESVVGYPNGLDPRSYVSKPALDLILQAASNTSVPHFLILDEMNLSHVERYFAEFLSAIESAEAFHLHPDDDRQSRKTAVPGRIVLPNNLFIIGTVNVDETTYMFSPKVLDRANVLEFRMSPDELKGFLESARKPALAEMAGLGYAAGFGESFVAHANDSATVPREVKHLFDKELLLFFQALQSHGAEFGYRTAYEAGRFMHYYKLLGDQPDDSTVWFKEAFDCVVVQKLLPKLHGSRAKLGPVLKKLWFLCITNAEARSADALMAAEDAVRSTDKRFEPTSPTPDDAPYPLSAEKIARMWRLLMDNGFASFAEA